MDAENKHCWECLRRRLVCDSLKPICNRCRTAGIVCPGYDDKKPLTWITPGKVLSRTWKRKPPKPKKLADSSKSVTKADRVIPPPSQELRTELHDIAEALEYYNTWILPRAVANQLGTNHFLTTLSSAECFRRSTIHTLISMVISHRLYQGAADESPVWILVPSSRLFQHRQLAIQALRQLIQDEATVASDELITAVYTFMLAVVQQSIGPVWRPHFDIFLELVNRRGGFFQLFHSSPTLGLQLFAFWITGVLSNTTTPPDKHIPVLCSDSKTVALALRLFDRILYPYLPCPTQLFAHIVTINRLRCRRDSLSRNVMLPVEDDTALITGDLTDLSMDVEASELLHQIEEFSASDWADSKGPLNADAWLLVGNIYQSAVALFCLLSLERQFHSDEPIDDGLGHGTFDVHRQMHTDRLLSLLKEGLAHRAVRKSIMWPIVVAGAAAAYEGPETQSWLKQTLCVLSKELGSPLPLTAKEALAKFWMSGSTKWDDCFDVAYCFVV